MTSRCWPASSTTRRWWQRSPAAGLEPIRPGGTRWSDTALAALELASNGFIGPVQRNPVLSCRAKLRAAHVRLSCDHDFGRSADRARAHGGPALGGGVLARAGGAARAQEDRHPQRARDRGHAAGG